jgi:hypothetical protein
MQTIIELVQEYTNPTAGTYIALTAIDRQNLLLAFMAGRSKELTFNEWYEMVFSSKSNETLISWYQSNFNSETE